MFSPRAVTVSNGRLCAPIFFFQKMFGFLKILKRFVDSRPLERIQRRPDPHGATHLRIRHNGCVHLSRLLAPQQYGPDPPGGGGGGMGGAPSKILPALYLGGASAQGWDGLGWGSLMVCRAVSVLCPCGPSVGDRVVSLSCLHSFSAKGHSRIDRKSMSSRLGQWLGCHPPTSPSFTPPPLSLCQCPWRGFPSHHPDHPRSRDPPRTSSVHLHHSPK